MMIRIKVKTPAGQDATHVRSHQNGDLKLRLRPDGGFDVLGVHETAEVRSHNDGLIRPARRDEEVLGTYPPGSTYTAD